MAGPGGPVTDMRVSSGHSIQHSIHLRTDLEKDFVSLNLTFTTFIISDTPFSGTRCVFVFVYLYFCIFMCVFVFVYQVIEAKEAQR